jgi:hypothetical protein
MNIQMFDYSVNNAQALLWQYNEAVNLISLIEQKQAWYDLNQEQFWSDWYTNVFDLATADEFGLVVWSILLNVPYYINTGHDDTMSTTLFGFNAVTSFPTDENTYQNFNGIGTSSPSAQLGANFSSFGTRDILTVEQQRFVLRLRYFQLVTDGDIPGINTFLNWLITNTPSPLNVPVWALDGFNMTMRYIFNGYLPDPFFELLTIRRLDLWPRPATVGIAYVNIARSSFGFGNIPADNTYQNFGNGTFYNLFLPET